MKTGREKKGEREREGVREGGMEKVATPHQRYWQQSCAVYVGLNIDKCLVYYTVCLLSHFSPQAAYTNVIYHSSPANPLQNSSCPSSSRGQCYPHTHKLHI